MTEDLNKKFIRAMNTFVRTMQVTVGDLTSVTLSRSVFESPHKLAILDAVRNFSDFNYDNDPYGERDFGVVKVGGDKWIWKISYYDKNPIKHHDAAHGYEHFNLLVMRADEY